jgi:hypothetical protein
MAHPTTDMTVTDIPVSPLLCRKRPAPSAQAKDPSINEKEDKRRRPPPPVGDVSLSSYDATRYCVIGRNEMEKTVNILLPATGQIGTHMSVNV